jgi:hypothetical protein
MRLGAVGMLCALFVAACTGSEKVRLKEGETDAAGSAGEPAPGEAGTSGEIGGAPGATGAAGVTGSGAGPGSAGEAAMSGTAGQGSTAGTAGTSGSVGTSGTGGKGGSGGTRGGAAGTTGTGGSTTSDAGAAGAGAGPEVTYTNLIGNNLSFYCGGCHAPPLVQNGFSLSYANLLAHVSSATSGCTALDASKARVVPGKPENSLIYIKMHDPSPPAGCGGHMPSMGNTVPANQQQVIYDWILAGAKE